MSRNPKFSHTDQAALQRGESTRPTPGNWAMVVIAWVLVGVPLAWGIYKTFEKAAVLFRN